MAGKPGRSGGARPGAGRPAGQLAIPPHEDALTFLLAVMNNPMAEDGLRLRAGIAAAQYQHIKKGDGGKKDERREAAEKAAEGKYATPATPKLVVNNT